MSTLPSTQILASNLLLQAELGRVSALFRDHQIEWVVLKGLPLARRVYGSISRRFSVDNDILVRRSDVSRAFSLLTKIGYQSAPGRSLDADLATTFQHPMRVEFQSGLRVRLELHWNAFPPHLYPVPEELLWAHLESSSVNDLELRVFDAELTLLHLASHFVQHRCSESRILEDVGRALTIWEGRLNRVVLKRLAGETGTASAFALVSRAAWALGLTAARPWVSDGRAELVFRLLSREGLGDCGQPSYWRMGLSLLLAAPGHLPGALKHELFPHESVLSRIYGRPVPKRPYALHLRRLARLLSPHRLGRKLH